MQAPNQNPNLVITYHPQTLSKFKLNHEHQYLKPLEFLAAQKKTLETTKTKQTLISEKFTIMQINKNTHKYKHKKQKQLQNQRERKKKATKKKYLCVEEVEKPKKNVKILVVNNWNNFLLL